MVIDVSQSVEHSHPHALEFLRRDCANVNLFFSKVDVQVRAQKSGKVWRLEREPLIPFFFHLLDVSGHEHP